MTFTGEQVVYGKMKTPDEIELMQLEIGKYNWALEYCGNKDVVDLGCGTGFGSYMVSLVAENVVGFDRSKEAIEYATDKWGKSVRFNVQDLDLYTPGMHFDVAVCFECLEHLEHPDFLLRNLDANVLVCSIPIGAGKSEFHKQDFPNDSDAERLIIESGWKIIRKERYNRANGKGSLMMVCER